MSFEPPQSPARAPSLHAVIARLKLGRVTPLTAVWGACVLVLLWVAIGQVQRALEFSVDDAYITFSFSKNLAAGHGPVFSHGLRVEGYSNFLWMVVLAIRYLFARTGDPLGFGRVLAFGCLAVAIITTYRLTRRTAGPLASLVPAATLVCCSDLFRAAASALETVPFAAAIVVGWYFYLTEPPHARRWSLLAFLPAALLRIDGFVPMLVVLGVESLTMLNERRFSLLKLARWAAPPILLWAGYFAWRYAYYGLLLPTTYYAKSVVTQGDPERGFHQAYDLVHDYGLLAVLPLGFLPLVRGPRRAALGLGLAVLLQVAHAINVGGDWMPFNRFFLPIVPIAAVLVGWGCEAVWSAARGGGWLGRWLSLVVMFSALLFTWVHMHAASVDSSQEREKLGTAQFVGDHTRNNLLAVKDLMAYVVRRPGDRLVTDYAGVFSVYTDAEVIDMWGLCNEDIALHGGTSGINPIYGKECSACYARIKPDYFHIGVPIVRRPDTFHGFSEVLGNVFQGAAIDRVIDMRHNFAVGRVMEDATGRTLWFLERRRAGLPMELRHPASGVSVDYPFERMSRGD